MLSLSRIQSIVFFGIGLTVLIFAAPLKAQRDTSEANFRYTELIKECRATLNVPGSEPNINELFRLSTYLQDPHKQSVALQYLLLHRLRTKAPKEDIVEAVDSLKRFCRRHNDMSAYYFGWSQYIQTLVNEDSTMVQGKAELESMMREASDEDNNYGKIQCYRRLSHYYMKLHLWDTALLQNKEAIELTELTYPNNHNLPVYYLDNARICEAKHDYAAAYDYLQKSLNMQDDKLHKLQALAHRCRLDALTGDYNSICKTYNEAMSDNEMVRQGQNTHFIYILRFYYNLASPDFEKAASTIRDYEAFGATPEQTIDMKLFLASAVASNVSARHNIRLPYDIKEQILKYETISDSINNQISQYMANHNNLELDAPLLIRQQREEERAMGARRRLIGTTMLCVSGALIIILTILIVRNTKKNQKLRLQTSSVAKKNIHLQMVNNELQASIENLKAANNTNQSRIEAIAKDSRMKSTFITSMARELRMVAMNGMDKASVDQLLEYAKNMEVLQNLATRDNMACDELNLNLVCQEVFNKYLSEHQSQNGVKFYFEPAPESNPMVQANTELLTLIICNLLRLAQRHTSKGEITLSTRRSQNGHLQMVVSDTGHGIPKHKRERLFEPLADIEDTDTDTLLHLTICRMAAHSQNCRIWVDTSQYTTSGTNIIVEF